MWRPSRYRQQNDEKNVPDLDSYDGCSICKYVGRQGKHQICQLYVVGDVDKVNDSTSLVFLQSTGNDHVGARCNRKQAKDCKWVEGGRVRQSRSGKGSEEKRTDVDSKHDDWKYKGDPILIRTQDPSPQDYDTVGDNILSQMPGDSPSQGSIQGCSRMMI